MDTALIDQVLQAHLENLQSELPARTFTRKWKGRQGISNDDLKPGHFTLIYKGSRQFDEPYQASIQLLIIGRIYCGAHADGLEVEQAELLLEDEIRQYSEGAAGIALQVNSVVCSHQVDAPHGWVVLECQSGPHDLHHSSLFEHGTPYTGDVTAGNAGDVWPLDE